MRVSRLKPDELTEVLEGAAEGFAVITAERLQLAEGLAGLTPAETDRLSNEDLPEDEPWLVIRALRNWVDVVKETKRDVIAAGGEPITADDYNTVGLLYVELLWRTLGGDIGVSRDGAVWLTLKNGTQIRPHAELAKCILGENSIALLPNMLKGS